MTDISTDRGGGVVSAGEPVFMRIAIDKIVAGNNIRLERDVSGLAASIAKHGILQPITVVHTNRADNNVECVFGHRRLAAAKAAGLKTVPCLVRRPDSKEIRVLTQLAENRDRRDMTKLEEALVYAQLQKLGMSRRQIAASVGTHESAVSDRLALLKYPDVVQQAVHFRKIGLGDALALPLELAAATDGRTLAAVCRRGGRNLRNWVRRQLAENETPVKKRKAWSALNLDADLIDDVGRAAAGAGVTIVEWASKVLRAELDAQAQRIEAAS